MKHINCPSRFFLMCGNLQLSENMSQRIQLHLVDVKCTAIHETKHNLPGKLSFSSKDVSLSGIPDMIYHISSVQKSNFFIFCFRGDSLSHHFNTLYPLKAS